MKPETIAERSTACFNAVAPEYRREIVLQALAGLGIALKRGKLEPCPGCNGFGGYRGTDAAGSADWLTCRTCQGWTVIEKRK